MLNIERNYPSIYPEFCINASLIPILSNGEKLRAIQYLDLTLELMIPENLKPFLSNWEKNNVLQRYFRNLNSAYHNYIQIQLRQYQTFEGVFQNNNFHTRIEKYLEFIDDTIKFVKEKLQENNSMKIFAPTLYYNSYLEIDFINQKNDIIISKMTRELGDSLIFSILINSSIFKNKNKNNLKKIEEYLSQHNFSSIYVKIFGFNSNSESVEVNILRFLEKLIFQQSIEQIYLSGLEGYSLWIDEKIKPILHLKPKNFDWDKEDPPSPGLLQKLSKKKRLCSKIGNYIYIEDFCENAFCQNIECIISHSEEELYHEVKKLIDNVSLIDDKTGKKFNSTKKMKYLDEIERDLTIFKGSKSRIFVDNNKRWRKALIKAGCGQNKLTQFFNT